MSIRKRRSNKKEYPQAEYGFFRNLEPIPDAVDTINSWMHNYSDKFDVWFLTRPSFNNPLCYTEKAEWNKEHFGMAGVQKLIICPDKSLVKGDYLIDDSTKDGQLEFEGKHIHYGVDVCDWWGIGKAFGDLYFDDEEVVFPPPKKTHITLKDSDGEESILCESDYNKLKASGFLWELYPDAPDTF